MPKPKKPDRVNPVLLQTTVGPKLGKKVRETAAGEGLKVATWLRRLVWRELGRP